MTTRAREVLNDCKYAHSQLTNNLGGREWRIRWIGALAICRAVGHILDKTDRAEATHPEMADAIRNAWAALTRDRTDCSNAIFWDFIEEDRNLAIKAYGFNAAVIAYAVIHIGGGAPPPPPDPLFGYRMQRGPYAGQDPRDVLACAIAWWESYLDGIDADYLTRKERNRGAMTRPGLG